MFIHLYDEKLKTGAARIFKTIAKMNNNAMQKNSLHLPTGVYNVTLLGTFQMNE